MRVLSAPASIILLGLLYPPTVFSQDDETNAWPKEITIPQGKVVMYQPQPDKLEGNRRSTFAAAHKYEHKND